MDKKHLMGIYILLILIIFLLVVWLWKMKESYTPIEGSLRSAIERIDILRDKIQNAKS